VKIGEPIFDMRPGHGIKFVSKIWFAMGEGVDLMAMTFQADDGTWRGRYRFRYYATSGAWDGKDKKNVWNTGAAPDQATLDKAFGEMIVLLCAVGFGDEIHELTINGDGDKAGKAIMAAPWAHALKTQGSA
jgi:hypothetical protein